MDSPPPARAGWYPDPSRPDSQRYWDGRSWTDDRAPMATQPESPMTTEPVGDPVPVYSPEQIARLERRARNRLMWAIICALTAWPVAWILLSAGNHNVALAEMARRDYRNVWPLFAVLAFVGLLACAFFLLLRWWSLRKMAKTIERRQWPESNRAMH